MKKIQADVVVIGGGTAGMGAFRNARLHSDNVYLIENNVFGTTCARVGCMPSKLLIAAAEARHHALHTDPFGVHLDKNSIVVNGEEVMQRVKSERDRFVGFVVADVEEWPADKRIMGSAKFIDENTVQIDDHTQITAKSFVIATGSRPVILPQWQSLGDRLIINDDVFSWDTLPKSVAVFGPGVIGLELGQALHRLGVKVEIFGLGGIIGGPVARRLINKELRRMVKKPLTQNQLNVALKQVVGQIGISDENLEQHAIGLGKSFAHYGRYQGSREVVEHLRELTPQRLQEIAAEVYDVNRLTTLVYN